MKSFLRSPLFCFAVLAIYIVVQVVAAAHHHHHGLATPESKLATCNHGLPGYSALPDDIDDDDEGGCLLCSVLHLPQTLPTPCHLEATTALCDRTLIPEAIIRSHPRQTATHSRAPPGR
jgi:hypothetical protein